MASRFVGRQLEQRSLQDAWDSGRPELVVVHGRRRVGKSALLTRWAKGKRVAYFVAAQQLERVQLDDLGATLGPMATGFRGGRPPRVAIRDWDEALAILADAARTQRVGLVLDEFPYLVDATSALPSLVQRWWDATGARANVVLVLSGSQQAMMSSLVSADGALYGRPTRRIHVQPFDYFHAGQFARSWTPEDRIRLYAVAGGVPDYLEEFDELQSLDRELERLAFSADGRLFREAPDLLRSEFSEPRTYESIVRSIAAGATTPALIADGAGLSGANRTTPYLERLQELSLVVRRTPPSEAARPRPRISQYVLADPYLRFYYKFVDPWRSAIALGQGRAAFAAIGQEALDQYVSRVFEDVVAQYLVRLAGSGELPPMSSVGFEWFAGGDVDAVGVANGAIVAAASAKWRREFTKPRDLDDLRSAVAVLDPDARARLFIVSRSGFDRHLAAATDVSLVGLRQLFSPSLEYEG